MDNHKTPPMRPRGIDWYLSWAVVGVMAVVAVSSLGLVYGRASLLKNRSIIPTASVETVQSSEQAVTRKSPEPKTQSKLSPSAGVFKKPTPPSSMADWYVITEDQRLDFINSLGVGVGLPAEEVGFLRQVIQDKQLQNVTRNNASNVLLFQPVKDPGLAAIFCKMLLDESENEQWRDYSLQFMAASTDYSDEKNKMAETIWAIGSSGSSAIAGTALLHLNFLHERGVAPLPAGYTQRLASLLDNTEANIGLRVTVAGIAAQRHVIELGPKLCALAETSPHPAVRRAALAALGQIGGRDELSMLQRHSQDPDPIIALAARNAADVIYQNISKPSPQSNQRPFKEE